MNNYRKQLGLKELTPDLYLINLVYDDILEISYTGNITIGGIKNDKGENLGQYIRDKTDRDPMLISIFMDVAQ